jgi:hypothetical protein
LPYIIGHRVFLELSSQRFTASTISLRVLFSFTALSRLAEGYSFKIRRATLAKLCFNESSLLAFSQKIAE